MGTAVCLGAHLGDFGENSIPCLACILKAPVGRSALHVVGSGALCKADQVGGRRARQGVSVILRAMCFCFLGLPLMKPPTSH